MVIGLSISPPSSTSVMSTLCQQPVGRALVLRVNEWREVTLRGAERHTISWWSTHRGYRVL